MKNPVRVTITGAAGQIGYQLAFRIASGQMLGKDQPVILQLLEIPPALPALEGVVMELHDCAFGTLAGIVATDDANVAFKDSDFALLVGARPRGPGMERKDLLEANAQIFSVQGKAMGTSAPCSFLSGNSSFARNSKMSMLQKAKGNNQDSSLPSSFWKNRKGPGLPVSTEGANAPTLPGPASPISA